MLVALISGCQEYNIVEKPEEAATPVDTAAKPVCRAHGDCTDNTVTQLLLNLERQTNGIDFQCVIDLRHRITRELNVHDGADDFYHFTRTHFWFLVFNSILYC